MLRGVWVYRTEILLAVQVMAALRKSAQEIAREYIRKKIKTKLKHSLGVVGFQVAVLLSVLFLNRELPSLASRLLASLILWGITVYNLLELTLVTIPELRSLHRTLKGKVGYALKYLLEVSLVTELLRLNILFLAICLVLGISSRTSWGAISRTPSHGFSSWHPRAICGEGDFDPLSLLGKR